MKADPHRNSTISRTILDCLELASPYALPEASLRTEINARIRPPCGEEEFGEGLAALQRKRAVAVVEDTLDEELVKWTITEAGRAILAQIA